MENQRDDQVYGKSNCIVKRGMCENFELEMCLKTVHTLVQEIPNYGLNLSVEVTCKLNE